MPKAKRKVRGLSGQQTDQGNHGPDEKVRRTSCNDMPEFPVIVKTTPLAFSIGKSRRGEETA